MKNKSIIGRLTASLVTLCVVCIVAGSVQAEVPGFGADNCTVKSAAWGMDPDGLTLSQAIAAANAGTGCKTKITMEVSVDIPSTPRGSLPKNIQIIKNGLEIDGAGHQINGSFVNDAPECLIDVQASYVKIHGMTLIAQNRATGICLQFSSNQIGKQKDNGYDLKIQGATDNGIKIRGNNNILNDVQIENVVNGSAVVFAGGASGNRILPNCMFSGAGQYAIDEQLDNPDNAQGNIVVNTDRVPEGTDANGFVDWKDGFLMDEAAMIDSQLGSLNARASSAAPTNFKIGGANGRLIQTARKSIPIVTEIKFEGGTRYRIKGGFAIPAAPAVPTDGQQVDGGVTIDYGFKPINCTTATIDTTIQNLAVYSVSGSSIDFAGMVGTSLAGGRGINIGVTKVGSFEFVIDKNQFPGRFTLVPTDENRAVRGKASNYKTLTPTNAVYGSDCETGTTLAVGTTSGGGSGGTTGGGTVGNIAGWWGADAAACKAITGNITGSTPDYKSDSDDDGIPDYIEMSIIKKTVGDKLEWVYDPASASCTCDRNTKLSCWYLPDSDLDGILDMRELGSEGVNTIEQIKAGLITGYEALTDANSKRIMKPRISHKKADGTDDTANPDVTNSDSDGDGLLDGEEDHNRTYNQMAKAIFVPIDAREGFYPDASGAEVACNVSTCRAIGADGQSGGIAVNNGLRTGICYNVYIVGGTRGSDYVDKPILYSSNTSYQLTGSRYLSILACRSKLVTPESFDGAYTELNDASNLLDADTDGDCVCDGRGDGCRQIDRDIAAATKTCPVSHGNTSVMGSAQWLNDGCPKNPKPTNDCAPNCTDGQEILRAVQLMAPTEVQETTGRLQVKDADNNGQPDMFERTKPDPVSGTKRADWEYVQSVCPSDLDNDGIPDCVERFDGYCPGDISSSGSRVLFNPYDKDSDGDGFVDGKGNSADGSADNEDVCPLTPGAGDKYSKTNSGYSCDAHKVYVAQNVARIISCWMDRDHDGVRDCEEDLNMDGIVGSSVGDPTVWFEANDDVARKAGLAEIDKGIIESESDPLLTDTDKDGFDDHRERYTNRIKTNPANPDTDGDGLSDKDEDADNNLDFDVKLQAKSAGCKAFVGKDTNPAKPDTDDDTLSDYQEKSGQFWDDPAAFLNAISVPNVWSVGLASGSNPLTRFSDDDDLSDDKEYNGKVIRSNGSNPCLGDSDGDGMLDSEENRGCRLTNRQCVGTPEGQASAVAGVDSDQDGSPDIYESMLKTDPNNPDTDGDGLLDGEEDFIPDGRIQKEMHETNPLLADTDNDGLNDKLEFMYGTDANQSDSDGDGLQDGMEDGNKDGDFDAGTETDATKFDTDGDGLWDGRDPRTGAGEDYNLNGIRDKDDNGNWKETDPRLADSDNDGNNDMEEMAPNGVWDISNVGRATEGQSSGCSMVAGGRASPIQMIIVLMALIAVVATRFGFRVMKSPA